MKISRIFAIGIISLSFIIIPSYLRLGLLFAGDKNLGSHTFKAFGKFGLYRNDGKIIITPQFDGLNGFSDGLAVVRFGGEPRKWGSGYVDALFGYIDIAGKIVIPPSYEQAELFSEGLAPVKEKGGKWGFIDKSGHMAIKPIYEDAYPFNQGLAQVKCSKSNGRYGFIDKTGKLVIQPRFEYFDEDKNASRWNNAVQFHEGLAAVKDGSSKKYGFIDKAGTFVIPPKFEYVSDFKDGKAKVKAGSDPSGSGSTSIKFGLINKKGEFIIPPKFDSIGSFKDGIAVFDVFKPYPSKMGFIDYSGTIIVQPQFESISYFSEGLAAVRLHGKWGYIDKTGNMVIKPRFSQAEAFCEGLAAVRLPDKQSSSGKLIPGKFGFIDKSRQFIIKPHFEYAQGFKDGIAWVRISVKKNPNKDTSDLCVGYINKKGTYIIKPEFDDIFGFHNSPYAEARKVYRKDRHGNILSSEEGLIDKTGTFIWSERRDSGRKDPFDKGYVLVNMAKGSGYIKPRITRKTFKKGTVDEEYPQIEGMEDKAAQQHINTMLLSRYTLNKYEKGTEYSGTFSLEYNRYSIVSLTVDTGFWAHSPHGYYYMMGYTINTATGKIYELKDLFLQNTSWLGRLNGVVSKEIQSRVNKGELSLFEPFKGIDGTEKFYLSEEKNSLVIFYDLYEISAYVYGRVFVEIPMKDLNDIIKPEFKTII